MAGIFISYRRSTASTTTYRLVDDLRRAFGPEQIFLDVESIQPGLPFAKAIQQSMKKSSVALIMIDPQWVSVTDEQGTPRLQNVEDWVREEVRAALSSSARVIPVLIEGAQMPEQHDLPADIQPLANLQAFTLLPSQAHWAFDVNRLIEQVAAIDHKLVRIDSQQSAAGGTQPAAVYSRKVISGFVIYALITLTAAFEGWDDSDEVMGAVLFLLVAGGLFIYGFLDVRKGLSRGKKGAITGIVLSALSLVGHLSSYAMMEAGYNASYDADYDTSYATPSGNAGLPATAAGFSGSWVSQQGVVLQMQQRGSDVSFVEYNAFGGQVGQGEGSVSGSQLTFNYYNPILRLSASGTANLNGQTMQMTLLEPNSGQRLTYIYYRQ